MTQNFLINIFGTQHFCIPGDDDDRIEMKTVCNYEYEDGLYYIEYSEAFDDDDEYTAETSIEIGNDYVSIQRTGAVNSDMLFISGRTTYSMYKTPYGDMMVGIYTNKLDINTQPNCCTIDIDYNIDINDKPCGRHKTEIYVLEANQK